MNNTRKYIHNNQQYLLKTVMATMSKELKTEINDEIDNFRH